MSLRLVILVCALLAVSACIVEPFGGGGYYRGGGEHDYGHRAWRG